MKNAPHAHTVFQWLRDNLGREALAPLTSTDSDALRAAVQTINLLGYNRDPDLIKAFRTCVMKMQPNTRGLAFHAIAHVLDWRDRYRIWDAAGLAVLPTSVCKYEPAHR